MSVFSQKVDKVILNLLVVTGVKVKLLPTKEIHYVFIVIEEIDFFQLVKHMLFKQQRTDVFCVLYA